MSTYKTKLKEFISNNNQLKEIDFLVDKNKTTHKVVYECLHYGLTLDETWFILETHRSLFFNPSITNLRKLFIQLRKDQELLSDAIEFLEENHDLVSESIHPGVEGFMKDDHIIYEFSKMLKKHKNSLDDLKMYIESFQWDEDKSEEEEDEY